MFSISKFNDSSHFWFVIFHKWDHLQLLGIRFDDLIIKTVPHSKTFVWLPRFHSRHVWRSSWAKTHAILQSDWNVIKSFTTSNKLPCDSGALKYKCTKYFNQVAVRLITFIELWIWLRCHLLLFCFYIRIMCSERNR